MAGSSLTGSLAAPHIHIPSTQMVIRRYRPFNEDYIRSFFTQGVYCHHLPRYTDDENEGLVENAIGNGALRGAAAEQAAMMRRRRDLPDIDISEEEFEEAMIQYHKDTRHKNFANCWRLGTDETERIWKEYTGDDAMVEGIAFETTVGQFAEALPLEKGDRPEATVELNPYDLTETPVEDMYVGSSSSDITIGAVWYQARALPGVGQPEGYQAAINFYKDREYDDEKEFRLVINPFDTATMLQFDIDAHPVTSRPSVEQPHRFFPMNTVEMVDKIILAPYATGRQRSELEHILDGIGISYGSEDDTDVEIVNSQITGSSLNYTHDYAAEFGGTDNYEGTAGYLNEIREDFVDDTESELWSVIDLVELTAENWGTVVEGYRHPSENPVIGIEEYGIQDYQAIFVDRININRNRHERYQNDRAEDLIEKRRMENISQGFEWLLNS